MLLLFNQTIDQCIKGIIPLDPCVYLVSILKAWCVQRFFNLNLRIYRKLNKEINKPQQPAFGIMYPQIKAVAIYSHVY